MYNTVTIGKFLGAPETYGRAQPQFQKVQIPNNLEMFEISKLLETLIKKCNCIEKYRQMKNTNSRGLGEVAKVPCTFWEEVVKMEVDIFYNWWWWWVFFRKIPQKYPVLAPHHIAGVKNQGQKSPDT